MDRTLDSAARDSQNDFETRVAIDVMFEALSHIQASIDASGEGEEARVESYRRFKEALYERYEYLLEERREEQGREEAPSLQNGHGRNGHPAGAQAEDRHANGSEDGADSSNDDTLGKLWPEISEKHV